MASPENHYTPHSDVLAFVEDIAPEACPSTYTQGVQTSAGVEERTLTIKCDEAGGIEQVDLRAGQSLHRLNVVDGTLVIEGPQFQDKYVPEDPYYDWAHTSFLHALAGMAGAARAARTQRLIQ